MRFACDDPPHLNCRAINPTRRRTISLSPLRSSTSVLGEIDHGGLIWDARATYWQLNEGVEKSLLAHRPESWLVQIRGAFFGNGSGACEAGHTDHQSSGTQRACCWSGRAGREMPRYDIRDDQALPHLQTATHKKAAHRYGTVHLWQACLAGIAAGKLIGPGPVLSCSAGDLLR